MQKYKDVQFAVNMAMCRYEGTHVAASPPHKNYCATTSPAHAYNIIVTTTGDSHALRYPTLSFIAGTDPYFYFVKDAFTESKF